MIHALVSPALISVCDFFVIIVA